MEGGECKGVIALCLEDGTLHRFKAKNTVSVAYFVTKQLCIKTRTLLVIKFYLFIFST